MKTQSANNFLTIPSLMAFTLLCVLFTGCENQPKVSTLDTLPDSLQFELNDPLLGKDITHQLSYITQIDKSDSTTWDIYRCGASAALNGYLHMGGSWPRLVSTLKLPDTSFTYANVYLAQEKLFLASGGDSTGILGQYYPKWDDSGKLIGYTVTGGNLLSLVFENLDMYVKPLLPTTISDPKGMKEAISKMYSQPVLPEPVADIKDKKDLVLNYFKSNPQGALVMGVNEDMEKGKSTPAIDERVSSQNHYIMCFQQNGSFYTLDTWREPGHKTLTKLTEQEVEEMLFSTHNMLLAMYFK